MWGGMRRQTPYRIGAPAIHFQQAAHPHEKVVAGRWIWIMEPCPAGAPVTPHHGRAESESQRAMARAPRGAWPFSELRIGRRAVAKIWQSAKWAASMRSNACATRLRSSGATTPSDESSWPREKRTAPRTAPSNTLVSVPHPTRARTHADDGVGTHLNRRKYRSEVARERPRLERKQPLQHALTNRSAFVSGRLRGERCVIVRHVLDAKTRGRGCMEEGRGRTMGSRTGACTAVLPASTAGGPAPPRVPAARSRSPWDTRTEWAL